MVTGKLVFQSGTNRVEVMQPKDVVIDSLEIDPVTGRVTLRGYQSAANVAAIEGARAQTEAIVRISEQGIAAAERGAARYFSAGLVNPRGAASPAAAAVASEGLKLDLR